MHVFATKTKSLLSSILGSWVFESWLRSDETTATIRNVALLRAHTVCIAHIDNGKTFVIVIVNLRIRRCGFWGGYSTICQTELGITAFVWCIMESGETQQFSSHNHGNCSLLLLDSLSKLGWKICKEEIDLCILSIFKTAYHMYAFTCTKSLLLETTR